MKSRIIHFLTKINIFKKVSFPARIRAGLWPVPYGTAKATGRAHGFTLIEVICTLVFISLGLIPLLKMFAVLNASQAYREHSIMASNLMQRKMEEVKCIKNNNFSALIEDIAGSSYTGYLDYKLFVYETNDWKGYPNLKKVDVRAEWPYPGGGTSAETISTVMAEH